jgi:hypothetical protein
LLMKLHLHRLLDVTMRAKPLHMLMWVIVFSDQGI